MCFPIFWAPDGIGPPWPRVQFDRMPLCRYHPGMRKSLLCLAFLGLGGCAAGTGSSEGPVSQVPERDAEAVTVEGLTVHRPDGWVFVGVDDAMTPDTVAALLGPVGEGPLRPSVEIARRKLDSDTQRRKPVVIVTQVTTEIVQAFASFDAVGGPEELELGGYPAARLRMNFTETLPEGGDTQRVGEFYAIVRQGEVWIIRYLDAPSQGSATAFQTILDGLNWS